MKINRPLLLFLIAFLFFILGGHLIPITDSVESNYALTAKEMVLSSDWISPRIYGKAWFDKPVLIYWLLAAAIKLLGYSELALRSVPALAGAAGVTLVYWFAKKLGGERTALLAAIMLGTSLQYFAIAKLIITDMVLFDLNAAALAFFYLGYTARDETKPKRWYLPMYACLGLAVLTKGPVGILLPGLIILLFLAWQKGWSELKRMHIGTGLLLFAAIALPWYLIMIGKHGPLFIQNFLGVHNYLRATVSEHPKDNVFYYYGVVFLVSALPWTGVMIGGVVDALKKIRQNDNLAQFLISWVAVFLIFYSCIATKYLTYTFPILFPITILTALYIENRLAERSSRTKRWLMLLWFWPWLLFQVLIVLLGYHVLKNAPFWALLLMMVVTFVITFWHLYPVKDQKPFLIRIGGVIIAYVLLATLVLPAFAQSKSGKQFAQTISPYRDYQIGTYQFYSTSAVYYGGRLLKMIEPQRAIANYRNPSLSWYAKYTMPTYTIDEFQTQAGAKKLIIVPARLQPEFLKEAAHIGLEKIDAKKNYLFYRIKPN
jgi:4-amino-4-deoxy-L-arabinose transferase-like glycosyltransferase